MKLIEKPKKKTAGSQAKSKATPNSKGRAVAAGTTRTRKTGEATTAYKMDTRQWRNPNLPADTAKKRVGAKEKYLAKQEDTKNAIDFADRMSRSGVNMVAKAPRILKEQAKNSVIKRKMQKKSDKLKK